MWTKILIQLYHTVDIVSSASVSIFVWYHQTKDHCKANDHCKAMTKFRISAHNLAIERGRYTRPPTPVNDRICSFCSGNVIEDEFHFLMTCKKTDRERNTLFNSIHAIICKNFNSLSDTDKFIFMMSSEGEIAKNVAKFIYDHLPRTPGTHPPWHALDAASRL